MVGDKIVLNKTGTHFYLDGKEVSEKKYRVRHPLPPNDDGVPGGTQTTGWPIVSDALKLHPKQLAEHERLCREKGIPTETTPDGRVILRNRAHRKSYLRAFGFHDRDGGYSD